MVLVVLEVKRNYLGRPLSNYSSTIGDKAKLRERDVEGRGSGRILRRKIPGFTTTNDLIYQTFPVLLSGLDKPALAD